MAKISIVIPVYFNEDSLAALYDDLNEKVLCKLGDDSYEIIMVNDSSGDNSYAVMKELSRLDKNIKTISLSRNFGSHAASLCGLLHATGDCAVTKSADLQEPSELIIEMFSRWKEGANVVLAVREDRADPSLFSSLYYWLTRKVAIPTMPKTGFDQFLADRKVIEVLSRLDEPNISLTGQLLWCGFKTEEVRYSRKARETGVSRWTLKKKIRLVSDTLYGFSTAPITAVSIIGAVSCAGSFLWAIYILCAKLLGTIEVPGWTTLFVFQLFSFGVVMLTLGILGGYLWRAFDSARGRPTFIVEEDGTMQDVGGRDDSEKGHKDGNHAE